MLCKKGWCAYCDKDISQIQYHVDHVLSLAVGGTNNVNNLALACPTCNLKAGAKAFQSFMHKKMYLLETK